SRGPRVGSFGNEKIFVSNPAVARFARASGRRFARIDAARFGERPGATRPVARMWGVDSRESSLARTAFAAPRARRCERSEAELALEQVVDRLRIGFAAGRLHHLADEPAERLRLVLHLRSLVGIGRDDVVDDLLDRREVGDLLHAAALHERARVAALL